MPPEKENEELEAQDKDAALEEELEEKEGAEDQESEGTEDQDSEADAEDEPGEEEEEKEEVKPKTYSQEYVTKLRNENAKGRIENRRLKEQGQPVIDPKTGKPVAPAPGQTGQYFDPRVDDMIIDTKVKELKGDPDLKGLFVNDQGEQIIDEDGVPFEERLLEKALELQWPIGELDALALKMGRGKLFGKIEQRAIDKTYKSLKKKKQDAGEKSGSSGKNAAPAEVKSIDDALDKTMEELGIKDISKLE